MSISLIKSHENPEIQGNNLCNIPPKVVKEIELIVKKVYGIHQNIDNDRQLHGLDFVDKFPCYNNVTDLLNDRFLRDEGMGGLIYELVIAEMFMRFLSSDSYVSLSDETMDKKLAIDMFGKIGGIDTIIQFSINPNKQKKKKDKFVLQSKSLNQKNKKRVQQKIYFDKWKMGESLSNNDSGVDLCNQKALYIHLNDRAIIQSNEMIINFNKWSDSQYMGHWLDHNTAEYSVNGKKIEERFKSFIMLIEDFMNTVNTGICKESDIITIDNPNNIYLIYYFHKNENKYVAGIIEPSGVNMSNRLDGVDGSNILGEITLYLK